MTSKHGKGSVIKMEKDKPSSACRKWKLVVSLGSDPLTGKRRRKSRTFYGTRAQAHEALGAFAEEANAGR